VDYLATRRLNLRFVNRDDNTRAYEFRHDVAFGANTTAAPRRDRADVRVVAVTLEGELALPESTSSVTTSSTSRSGSSPGSVSSACIGTSATARRASPSAASMATAA
jgi:hypothetical protein